MKSVNSIAQILAPRFAANNAAIGQTNRRLVRIGDGQGNSRPATLLTPRDVLYRSDLDQNDRGVCILSNDCPIPLSAIDGYYDAECWIANVPGSSQLMIVGLADVGGFANAGATPMEALANAAAFPDQSRLIMFRLRPSDGGGIAVFVDVGVYAVAYELPDGNLGFFSSKDIIFPDPTDSEIYIPTAAALASGEHRLVGIALNPATGKLIAIPGTASTPVSAIPSRNEFLATDYQAIHFTGLYPAGYVYTYYGQTDVEEDDCLRLYDPRLLIKAAGLRAAVNTTNVTNPPTEAELTAALGAPATVGAGFLALLDDNNAHIDEYLCWSDGTNWFYVTGTKAT